MAIAQPCASDAAARRYATLSDVESSVPETLTRGSQFFDAIERYQVGNSAGHLLRWLARSQSGNVSMSQLKREFGHTIDVASNLELLVRRELLEQVDNEYRF